MTEPTPIDLDTDLEPGDTFPRDYVERLRTEAAGHRTKARDAETARETAITEAVTPLQQRIHTLLVEQTGRLADPTDLPFVAEQVDDPAKLTAAIDALLTAKPHLAKRRVAGDAGQGEGTDRAPEGFSLAGALAARA